jgi:thiamine monophosphate kinase
MTADADYLLARHLRPMPRVLQGRRCAIWRHRLSISPTA